MWVKKFQYLYYSGIAVGRAVKILDTESAPVHIQEGATEGTHHDELGLSEAHTPGRIGNSRRICWLVAELGMSNLAGGTGSPSGGEGKKRTFSSNR